MHESALTKPHNKTHHKLFAHAEARHVLVLHDVHHIQLKPVQTRAREHVCTAEVPYIAE